MDKKKIYIYFFVILLSGLIIWLSYNKELFGNQKNNQIYSDSKDWKIITDSDGNIIFKYPENLGTKYINTVDWPPKVSLTNDPFSCAEVNSSENKVGENRLITINGREYCADKVSEDAEGDAIYTKYAYALAIKQSHMLIMTFSLSFSPCSNYDEPEKSDCQKEQQFFKVNALADQIISESFKLDKITN